MSTTTPARDTPPAGVNAAMHVLAQLLYGIGAVTRDWATADELSLLLGLVWNLEPLGPDSVRADVPMSADVVYRVTVERLGAENGQA